MDLEETAVSDVKCWVRHPSSHLGHYWLFILVPHPTCILFEGYMWSSCSKKYTLWHDEKGGGLWGAGSTNCIRSAIVLFGDISIQPLTSSNQACPVDLNILFGPATWGWLMKSLHHSYIKDMLIIDPLIVHHSLLLIYNCNDRVTMPVPCLIHLLSTQESCRTRRTVKPTTVDLTITYHTVDCSG